MKSSLNHIFRTIWSDALGTWVAVSELTSAKGKRSRSCVLNAAALADNDSEAGNLAKRNRFRFKSIAIALVCCYNLSAQANPSGWTVANGTASFNQSGNLLTITNSPNAIINWQSFSIAQGETTRFIQQSASGIVLNRVTGANLSLLLGTLTSNEPVILINPAGILVGAGANINVPGFVASTLNLSNADFLAGKLNFTANPNAGTIKNNGTITTPEGGTVYLIAPQVTNNGIITTPKGETILAAGNTVQLMDTGTPGVTVQITGNNNTATNLGQILADSGRIGVVGAVVNNSGTISANSLVSEGGRVFLKATSLVEAGGTITANGTSGGSVDISAAHSLDSNAPGIAIQTGVIQAQGTAGTGGTVSLSGDSILSAAAINVDGTTAGGFINVQASNFALSTASAQYTADSTKGVGGDILVLGNVSNYSSGSYSATGTTGGNLTFAGDEIKLAGAQFNANGNYGGGNIHVGGLMHGAAGFSAQGTALANATDVLTNSTANFTADALQSGNGGQVVLWSDQAMSFTGNISAKGGVHGGNGGMAEVSGLTSFAYGGLTNLSATKGLNGTLLIDPNNITIVAGTGGVSTPGNGVSVTEFLDPHPGAGYGFGGSMTELANGNILIISTSDGFGGTNAGAMFLYSPTGTLISSLMGSHANDQVGIGGVTSLSYSYGDYLVSSKYWNNNGTTSTTGLGAVTWFSDTAGVSGIVSASNSLVGSTAGDQVSSGGITQLTNGNYVVLSPYWGSNGTLSSALGAVTWGSGTTGVSGIVSSTNSLVGGTAGDQVGYYGVTALSSGDYVVMSPYWGSDGTLSAALGAVTWGSGTAGVSGIVSASNSLVGSTAGDQVGYNGMTILTNGNYTVDSFNWNGSRGAVTWVNGSNGQLSDYVSGNIGEAVSASNSLVGSNANDQVGVGGVTALGNGNYVVNSYYWNNNGTSTTGLGAVTWGSGAAGVTGIVSAANSLIGSTAGDQVGIGGVQELTTSGNYVVKSANWNGTMGAVTWGSGTAGVAGTVSSTNSLVGSTAGDLVGDGGVFQLTGNGNYVVVSYYWNNSSVYATTAGAVTWVNGSNGQLADSTFGGAISSTNSLVGSHTNDTVGSYSVTLLTNGNYVVKSPAWNGSMGAVTWGSGTAGVVGTVSATNSLVGSTAYDGVGSGGVYELTGNGNYLVVSPSWNNGGALASAGAVTWGSGTTGVAGAVSSSNSLVGSNANDQVGIGGVTLLSNGNYVVDSYYWNNNGTSSTGLGAVTWGSGTTGIFGDVSSTNSLVGSTAGDLVGDGGSYFVTQLSNSNYVVFSSSWSGSKGAVTWGSGTAGISGTVSASNSLVGSTAGDKVGDFGLTELTNGNYVVLSPDWGSNGTLSAGLGAVTWGSGTAGVSGIVSASNSLVGGTAGDQVGYYGVDALSNGNYVVISPYWGSNGTLSAALGAVTWGNGSVGTVGTVSASNSLVGSAAGDRVGSNYYVTTLSNGDYLVVDPYWNGSRGAVTWVNGSNGQLSNSTFGGAISSTNSLVGSNANDQVGYGGVTQLSNGNYVVDSYYWNNNGTTSSTGLGAVTWGSGTAGVTGTVSAANSLVGSTPGDMVGANYNCGDGCYVVSGVTSLYSGNYVVSSYYWSNGAATAAGAVTGGNGSGGLVGGVTATNSLMGSTTNEHLGGYVVTLSNGSNSGNVYVGASAASNGALAGAGRAFILSFGDTGTVFSDNPTTNVTIGAGYIAEILNANTNVVLEANTDIIQDSGAGITSTGTGNLTIEAGRSVTLNDVINIAGNLSITANDAGAIAAVRAAGTAVLDSSLATLTAASISLTNSGGNILVGSTTTTNTSGYLDLTAGNLLDISVGTVHAGGNLVLTAPTINITTPYSSSTPATYSLLNTVITASSLTISGGGSISGQVVAGGDITVSSGTFTLGNNDYTALVGNNISVIAQTLNMLTGGIYATNNVNIVSGSINANNISRITGSNITANVLGDFRLNNGSSLVAGNDVFLTFAGPTSTLYLDDSSSMSPSTILANASATTTLNFLERFSGGVVIDGVDTLSTIVGGSGIFTVNILTPAVDGGAGLIVNYSSNLATLLNPILPPNPTVTSVEPTPPYTFVLPSLDTSGDDPYGIGGTFGTFGGDDGNDNNKGKPHAKPEKC